MQVINDFSTSVAKAFSEVDSSWRDYNGLVVCGSHTPTNVEQTIDMIQHARENKVPYYGECFGYQLAAIEYARNVIGIKDATSEEFCTYDKHMMAYINKMAKEAGIIQPPQTRCMCGDWVVVKRKILKVGLHEGESWWSNYEVRPDIEKEFIYRPKWFFVAPFHPSYQSSKDRPHPLIKDFLEYAKYR